MGIRKPNRFTIEEISDFVKDHIQSKIDHNELSMTGLDMENPDNFRRELDIYIMLLFLKASSTV